MRNAVLIFLMFFLMQTINVFATDVNGKFLVSEPVDNKINVTLQINTNTGADDLGGATVVIKFDTMGVSFPFNPQCTIDYVFHNFNGGNYNTATITRPVCDQIWVNIDLPPANSNNGTIVSGTANWTDIVTITFSITNESYPLNLYWKTTSIFWQMYDADNVTSWQNGDFEDVLNYPLPVELSTFTAQIKDNNDVYLKWIVETSLNSYGFDIEKTNAINTVDERWEKVEFVEGITNSTFPVEFSFIDKSYKHGTNTYYRLKSIDNDGTFEYSDIVEVEYLPQTFLLEQNYPNPFNPSTKIRFSLPRNSEIKLEVFNLLGEKITDLIDSEMEAGNYEIEFTAENLASGFYLYRLSTDDFVDIKKMIVLR